MSDFDRGCNAPLPGRDLGKPIAGATHKSEAYGITTYWKRGMLEMKNSSLVESNPYPPTYAVACWFYFENGKWVPDRGASSQNFKEVKP